MDVAELASRRAFSFALILLARSISRFSASACLALRVQAGVAGDLTGFGLRGTPPTRAWAARPRSGPRLGRPSPDFIRTSRRRCTRRGLAGLAREVRGSLPGLAWLGRIRLDVGEHVVVIDRRSRGVLDAARLLGPTPIIFAYSPVIFLRGPGRKKTRRAARTTRGPRDRGARGRKRRLRLRDARRRGGHRGGGRGVVPRHRRARGLGLRAGVRARGAVDGFRAERGARLGFPARSIPERHGVAACLGAQSQCVLRTLTPRGATANDAESGPGAKTARWRASVREVRATTGVTRVGSREEARTSWRAHEVRARTGERPSVRNAISSRRGSRNRRGS